MGRYDPQNMPDYKPLAAYGLIGDSRTAALVGEDGSIDWACFPDFDSPSAFAAVLDPAAGYFCLRPARAFSSRQFYEHGTNVLCTEFTTAQGVARVRDFMPVIAERRFPASEIHRKLEGVSGHVDMQVIFEPRFDYGAVPPKLTAGDYGVLASHPEDGEARLALASAVPLEVEDGRAQRSFPLESGDRFWFIADWESHGTHPVSAYRSETRLQLTRAFWRRWVSHLKYQGNWREAVERSLLTLKMLTFGATGAVIAAPTTSLPEWPGGSRNWDYRYSWVRDSAFTLRALMAAGYVEEGTAYFDWLLERCMQSDDGLTVMYGVRGEAELSERYLPLRGWRDSSPVRIGNEAASQFQLDIYGSLIDSALYYHEAGGVLTMVEIERLANIVELVCRRWREPDDGVWEARSGPRHYTYSKTWAWVALDRGVRLARRLHLDLPWEEWKAEAEAVREEVLEQGYNTEMEVYTQSYASDVLDASVLVMPLTGIISANDPRFTRTRERIVQDLAAGPYPLLYRYDPRLLDDGVGGEEGAFLLPTFWLVECLVLSGMYKEARSTFESLLRYASPLGLLSEEVHPENSELLGNMPQGFSHLGLVNAALSLEHAEPVPFSMMATRHHRD